MFTAISNILFFVQFLAPATRLCTVQDNLQSFHLKAQSAAQLAISTAQIFRFFCRRLQIPTVICNFRSFSSSSTSSQRITPYQVSFHFINSRNHWGQKPVLAITKPSIHSAQTGLKVQVRTLTINSFITKDITPLEI